MAETLTSEPDPKWQSARREIGEGLLSILMPARNLASEIAANVRTVRAALLGHVPFEIVVIDDGSTDGTADGVRALQAEVPEARVLRLEQNVGKGGALKQGFAETRGSHVLLLDADLDLPPRQIPTFFDVMTRECADVVIGSKLHPDSNYYYPPLRRLTSVAYFLLVKALFGLPIHDTQTGIKLFRRRVLCWVFPRMLVKQYAFDLELLELAHLMGARISEAPIEMEYHISHSLVSASAVRVIVMDTLAVFYRARLLRYYQSIPDKHMPRPPPLVSIVIAYPRPSANLDEALNGIAGQRYRAFEVILLPDAPSGRTWPEGIREIPTGVLRPAEKRNLGIQASRGGLVAFLDDDAFPVPDWLERAVEHFSDARVLAVGGPGMTPGNDPYMAQLGGEVYANRLVSGGYRYRYVSTRVLDVDDFPSCNLFVRTDSLRALGGFRTDYWPGEDTYLCMEIVHRLGGKIRYEPWAIVYHHRRPLFLPHLRQIGRYALHRGYFARHHPSTSRRIGYMLPSIFVVGLVAGAAASMVHPYLFYAYAAGLGLYLFLTLLAYVHRSPARWVLVWLGIVATHIVYGARFLAGWFTRELPSQVQAFDHSADSGE